MKKYLLVIVLFIIGIVLIGTGVFLQITSVPNNIDTAHYERESSENNVNTTSYNVLMDISSFKFDEMQNTILNKLYSGEAYAYLISCNNLSNDDNQDFLSSYTLLSNDSIIAIIEKLKLAKDYNANITTSLYCPKYAYGIGIYSNEGFESSHFNLTYNGNSKLMLEYNDIVYSFNYNDSSEIAGFIENLYYSA